MRLFEPRVTALESWERCLAKGSARVKLEDEVLPAIFRVEGVERAVDVDVSSNFTKEHIAELLSKIDTNVPYILILHKQSEALIRDACVMSAFSDFKVDLQKEGHTSYSGRSQRPINVQSKEGVKIEEVMTLLRPLWAATVTKEDLVKHCPPEFLEKASAIAMTGNSSFWGMMGQTRFIGYDWNGFASLRLQFAGHRNILALPWKVVQEAIHGADSEDKQDPEHLNKALAEMSGDRLDELVKQNGVRFAKLGPHMAFIVPEGYILVEKTLTSTALGVKQTLMPSSPEAIVSVTRIWSTVPRAVHVCLDVAKKIQVALSGST